MDNKLNYQESFNRDGFLAINNLFNLEKIDEIKTELKRYISEKVPNIPDHHVFYEDKNDKSTLKQLQQMFNYDEYFKKLIEKTVIKEIAEIVLNEKVKPINLQFFNKPPGVGKPTPPHQDGYYFMLKKHNAVTCWLALEEVDHENGCIKYVRGSHQENDYRPHGKSNVLGFSQGIIDFGNENDQKNTVTFPGGPGTFLIHNAKTIHWADGNNSKTRSRKALGFIYYGESAEINQEAHNTYQEKLKKEMKEKNLI